MEHWDRPFCSGGDKYNPLSNGACAASEAAVSRLGGVTGRYCESQGHSYSVIAEFCELKISRRKGII